MPHSPNPITTLLFAASVLLGGIPTSAIAQITANPNDAGTIVNQNGNIINIEGGTQVGANLFQSLNEFRVNQGQTANFISNPAIQNILGRVTGGEASVINGIIQVTGGNSNLYLMNPAGIIFGAGASLNVPAAFTATTANGIGFGDNWFNAVGTNNYASLVGNPNGFAFTQAGTIFNGGNLAVNPGQNLTLLGGTVVSTGTISAPGGNITIAAIPGEQLVKITPEGSLLSLALPVETKAAINPSTLTPLTLPQLLTGANISSATGVTVENGVVKLTGADVNIDAGDVVATGNIKTTPATGNAGSVTLAATGGITVTGKIDTSAIDTNTQANGGDVRISTKTGNIQVGEIQANGSYVDSVGFGKTGSVNISSDTGNITASGKIENVNNVDFSTKGNITTSYIIARGSINLNTTDGEIKLGNPADSPTSNDSTTAISATNTLSVSAKGTIQAFSQLRGNSVKLSSNGGDVIITTIDAGSDGVDIYAAGLFQARGAFTPSSISVGIQLSSDAELSKFLQARGITFDTDRFIPVRLTPNAQTTIPTSIQTKPNSSKPAGSPNAQITIRYGGATRTIVNKKFDILNGEGVTTQGKILIQGGNGSYYTGPAVSGKLLPDIDDPYITNVAGKFVQVTPQTFADGSGILYRNETYSTTFPSDKFPKDGNGTVGALIVGGGSNDRFYDSVQTRAFPQQPIVTPPVTPQIVVDPPVTPPVPPQIVSEQIVNQSIVNQPPKPGEPSKINPSTDRDPCNTSNTVAVNPQTTNGTNPDNSSRTGTSSPSNSNNVCTPANDDSEILKIVDLTPNPGQNKQLNFDNYHPKFLRVYKRESGK